MICSFNNPDFKQLILDKVKIHTLREDRLERWQPFMKMHMWLYNPRNVSRNPHFFLEQRLVSKQQALIVAPERTVFIDGRDIQGPELELLAKNDGFPDVDSFFEYFGSIGRVWTGWLLHWTDFKY